MPRQPRFHTAGDVVHARTRFVGEAFFIHTDGDRAAVRHRLRRALRNTDVRVLGFAIMSNHIHLLLLMGVRPLESLYRSFHTALAMFLNARDGRLGAVVAGRPWAHVVEGDSIFACLRYLLRNPPDAGVGEHMGDSGWTSFRFHAEPQLAPSWFDVHSAARLAGFDANDEGSRKMIAAMESSDVEPYIVPDHAALTARVRKRVGAPVEVGTIRVEGPRVQAPIVARADLKVHLPRQAELANVVAVASELVGVSAAEARSGSRRVPVVLARALALQLWAEVCGQPAVVMATHLRVSESAASRLRSAQSATGQRARKLLAAAARRLED
jgi:hypothetical protein